VKPAHRRLFDRLAVGLMLLGGWWLASRLAGEYWIASPAQTIVRVVALAAGGQLAVHAAYTLGEAFGGFVIGVMPGLLLPFLLRRSPLTVAILDPFVVAGYGLPKLALAPLFILWFGIGIWSKIWLIAAVTFFFVFFNTFAGIRALDVRLVRMAQVAGANESQIARTIVWPSAVPYIFAGFRAALPYAIGGTIIAELISSNHGLGYLLELGAMNFDSKTMFAALFSVTLVVVIANFFLDAVERRLLRWRPVAVVV
jgi:NitT/TauT family transport system permease protein